MVIESVFYRKQSLTDLENRAGHPLHLMCKTTRDDVYELGAGPGKYYAVAHSAERRTWMARKIGTTVWKQFPAVMMRETPENESLVRRWFHDSEEYMRLKYRTSTHRRPVLSDLFEAEEDEEGEE